MSGQLRFNDAAVLRDHFDTLNYDRGIDTAAIVVNDLLWFAYCTDPDGAWFFESTDPMDRMVFDGDTGESWYERKGWDWVGPQIDAHGVVVLWPLGGVS